MKNTRKIKSVSQAKLPYFERIFKLLTHDQQELMFSSFAYQNLAVLCVKRIFIFPGNVDVVYGLLLKLMKFFKKDKGPTIGWISCASVLKSLTI